MSGLPKTLSISILAFIIATAIAIWKLGATPQPVSTRLPQREREAIVALADPKLVVGVEPGSLGARQTVAPGFAPDPSLPDTTMPDRSAPHWKAPTSGGSTGRPKIIVSEVRGELRDGRDFWDLLAAAFPGGSITGAPKVRAMEIITERERVARGAYCGSLFYVGFDGRADSSILIRTCVQRGGWVQCSVGGGIVAQSDPAAEYDETLHKAAGMLRALRDSA